MVTPITCQHLSIFCFDDCQKFFFRIFNSFFPDISILHFLAIIFGYWTFWLTPHVPPSTNIVILLHINHCRLFNAKSSLYIYIYIYIYIEYIRFGLVLLLINYCGLFNAKSSLYIFIKYIRFSLVLFYGISTIVGYSMLNLYIYIHIYK